MSNFPMLATLTVTTTGLKSPARPSPFVGNPDDEARVSRRHPERWSTADPDGRIEAGCLRLSPGRVRVPARGLADLAIGLDVPNDARPGLYRTLLEATEPPGLRALLTFPVGFEL